MSCQDKKRCSHLPMLSTEEPGFVAYSEKDADSKLPPIDQLRPPKGTPNVLVNMAARISLKTSGVMFFCVVTACSWATPTAFPTWLSTPGTPLSVVQSWGWDTYGQVSQTPAAVEFVALAGSGDASMALLSDGSLEVWGRDAYSQVSNVPFGYDFVAIAGGTMHCLALRSNGSIVSWGNSNYGQVTLTPAGNDFQAIAGGGYHSIAL